MPRDAKLGLVIGVGLVLVIAVVFFRHETAPPLLHDDAAPAAVAGAEVVPANLGSGSRRPASTTIRKPKVSSTQE